MHFADLFYLMELLHNQRLAFLSSDHAPGAILECIYDLAVHLTALNPCVFSGFHTPVEKVFFEQCCRTSLQLHWVRAFQTPSHPQIPSFAQKAFQANRLHISHYPGCTLPRATQESCLLRNRYLFDCADAILIAYTHEKSHTAQAVLAHESTDIQRFFALNFPENEFLFQHGVSRFEIPLEKKDCMDFQLDAPASLSDFVK